MPVIPNNEPSDAVLDELHAIRRRLLGQHGGAAGLATFLRHEEAKSSARLVATVTETKANGIEPPIAPSAGAVRRARSE